MPRRSEFVEYLLEQLAPLGDVTARGMFGGWGIYLDGRMFALVAFETFFIKADDESRAEFESAGLQPFTYRRSEKEVAVMSYYQPPVDALEDRELLCAWAQKGIDAARRATKRPPRKK